MSPASERNAGDEGPGAGAGQVDAALAARARLERLLAAPTPFRADTGEADPAVTAVLESTDRPRHEYLDAVWRAVTASRVIVPVIAHAPPGAHAVRLGASDAVPSMPRARGREVRPDDAARDATAPVLSLPDGHVGLPVFTSAAAMAAWRSDVRPVPVEPVRAARVACAATDQLWVLDPGTHDLRLPRPAVLALAEGESWVPSWRNGPVQAEVAAQLGEVPGVTGVAFAPGEEAELRVFVRIASGGGMPAVAAALEACQHIMVDPAWGDFIDTVELCALPA